MRLSELSPGKGSKKVKRVGRGPGSGHGKTSCKGHKGQKARSGGTKCPGFEGGQTPLQRRLPKRGFNNIFRKEFAIINLRDIERIADTSIISPETLIEMGLIRDIKDGLKVLGDGDIKRKITMRAHAFSAAAKEKIAKAGGTAEVI